MRVTRQSERIDERFHEAVLSDGLRARVIPRPGYREKFAILMADYGSIDQDYRLGQGEVVHTPAGVAHFLEHKLFEDEAGDVFNQFARYGASANAYTHYGETAYYYSTNESFYPCLDLLLDFVTTPYFTEEQIEKERAVIAQEIRMYEDSPGSRGHNNLKQALYHRHPVRVDIAGTLDSIQAIDKPLLEECHRTFYQPSNMLLVVSGDLDAEEVFQAAEAGAQRRLERCGPPRGLGRVRPLEPAGVVQARVEERMAVGLPRVLLGSKEAPIAPGPDHLRVTTELGFILDLVFGRASEFFETHSAAGLIDNTFSASCSMGRGGFSYLVLGGEAREPEALAAAVAEAFEAAQAGGLDEQDFLRLRNKAYGRFLRGFNSLESVACAEADATLQGWDILSYLDLLETIEVEHLQARLSGLYREENRAMSLVWPLES